MPIYQLPNGRWKIRNTLGSSPSKEAAEKRLAAIKARQAAAGKDTKKGHKS